MPGHASAPLALWFCLSLIMVLLWQTPLATGALPGPDDYMRMVRVFAILDGGSAVSYMTPRLGIGTETELRWSRLIDWPLVAVQGILELSLPRMTAALWTATIAPLAALMAFVFAALWYTKALVSNKSVFFAGLALMCLWALYRQFMPGRVDHHMWQAVLAVFCLCFDHQGLFRA